MSLINTEVKPFKATAYHNGKFVPVTDETLKGKWSVVDGQTGVGDCTVVPYKQIVIAVGDGAKASLSAFDHLIRSPLSAAA
jgi:alkyl hydroperoxide reductase subunit AhpF